MNLTSMKLSDSIIKFYIIKEKLISMVKSQKNGSFILEREDWLEGAGGDCWGADSDLFFKNLDHSCVGVFTLWNVIQLRMYHLDTFLHVHLNF